MMYSGSVKVAPGALVCKEQEFVGDITIGARTIIHPKVRIIAEAGPIIIGESNLIEERAEIINRQIEGSTPNETVMIIGNNNVFEVDSRSEALKIGDNNILEAKAHVGRGTELTNGCVIGAKCEVAARENLPENTVIYGSECQRRVQSEKPQPQTLQLEFLAKILPNYHYLKKPVKTPTHPTK